jgi:hypothetical protein
MGRLANWLYGMDEAVSCMVKSKAKMETELANEAQECQYQPEVVIEDYETTHRFLAYLVTCLEPSVSAGFTRIIEARYPGYDIGRKKMGVLFPDRVVVGRMEGVKYDDDLTVWVE